MSRLLVEGRTRISHVVSFPDVNPVIVQPRQAGTIIGPVPNLPTLTDFMAPTVIYNPDSVQHTFRSFLRGPAGGNTQLTPPGLPASIVVAPGQTFPLVADEGGPNLLHDQLQIEFEMQEAIVTPGAFPVFSTFYEVILAQLLTVKGKRFGVQFNLVNPATPSVIACPADARSRTIINSAPDANVIEGLAVSSFFRNRDNNPAAPPDADKTLTFTLNDPNAGAIVVNSQGGAFIVPEGSEAHVPNIDLLPGQTLSAAVAEATVSNDPLMFWAFVDNI